MRKFLLALAITVSGLAQADIIKCQFTEPFMTTTYSMVRQTLTITDNMNNTAAIIRNVSFQIKAAGEFELWNASKILIQRLNLNHQGSDGMSDLVFPYAVYWKSQDLHGGCTSNFLATH